ncbi:hypothetical protein [Solimicrobium silvestre]|uniref:hypothetical protein n=1 Tax=Solimicrobium silvestre TaxID=2099400 RepID=UPI000CFDCF1C|nr:hypothetical protein [Solimicrobium silvestre]
MNFNRKKSGSRAVNILKIIANKPALGVAQGKLTKSVFPLIGQIHGEAKDTVKLPLFGDAVNHVAHPDGMQETEHVECFWHAHGLHRAIRYIAPVNDHGDADVTGRRGPGVVVIGIDEISDFGIKVGCFMTRVQRCFHTVNSILFECGYLAIMRYPKRTWLLYYKYATPLMGVGIKKTRLQNFLSGVLCGIAMFAPTFVVALGWAKD